MHWATLFRLSIAIIFCVSAIAKTLRFRKFAQAVEAHPIVKSSRRATPLAAVVVATEVVITVALFSGVYTRGALLLSAGLLTTFALSTAFMLRAKGEPSDCGCLGGLVALRLTGISVSLNVVFACLSGLTAAIGADGGNAVDWGGALLVAFLYWLILYARSVSTAIDVDIRGTTA